jgi:hypothetical protein
MAFSDLMGRRGGADRLVDLVLSPQRAGQRLHDRAHRESAAVRAEERLVVAGAEQKSRATPRAASGSASIVMGFNMPTILDMWLIER